MIELIVGALLMRLGLTAYAAGSVRSKNVASVLGRNLFEWALSMLAFWAVGLAIAAQSGHPLLGIDSSMLFNTGGTPTALAGFAMLSVLGSILIGATAERSRLWPMMILSLVTAAVTYPIVAAWESAGWLKPGNGFVDYNGGGSIHVLGAVTAYVAVRFVRARDGKYHRDGSASMIPGHSLPMIILGAWLAAIGGAVIICHTAAAPGPAINLVLCIAASVLACAIYFYIRYSKIDLPVLAAAMIAGVVAMSAPGGGVSESSAVIIGLVAGLIVAVFIVRLDLSHRLDDVTGAVTIHGVVGAWGVLAAGLFHPQDGATRMQSLGVQAGGLVAIVLLAVVIAWLTLFITGRFVALRATDSDEFDGLDLAEHDLGSYPDFQQNTIKSFHLREM